MPQPARVWRSLRQTAKAYPEAARHDGGERHHHAEGDAGGVAVHPRVPCSDACGRCAAAAVK